MPVNYAAFRRTLIEVQKSHGVERGPCSSNTGAYCRARAKLPETVIRRLTLELADGCREQAGKTWLWHGRHVQMVDGTTVSMPDTKANQKVYPQQSQQKEGLGFPIARMVVLLSLSTGMLTGMAMGRYQGKETGEPALLRDLLDRFKPDEVMLADRYYCSYFMIALLMERGIDFVVRLHQRRSVDFRRGRSLGTADQLLTWMRPARPEWMDRDTYDRMPESIEVRQARVHVDEAGFRTKSLVVVTSLTHAKTYPKDDIAELYRARWQVELDIRTIKVTLGMDILRCRTPAMVHREIWTCLLAYNLIRQAMLQSARASGLSPRELSFTAAMQSVAANWQVIALSDGAAADALIEAAWATMADHLVGKRPGRVEPRAVKRRPKEQALLMEPRAQAKAKLQAA